MKTIILGALAIATVTFAACNNSNKTSHEGHDHDTATMADQAVKQVTDEKPVATLKPQFTNVDAKVVASLKSVIDDYLQIKNGLADDNSAATANGGKAMAAAMLKVDKSLLTPEQQKVYKENEDDLKEHAAHIGKNEGNIAHQREHFAQMSEDVYALVKAFGGGQTLYHDHCPMYNDNKGALWLSEVRAVKNPYFGNKMPACGIVEEVIQ
ncbi:uncharacterized protein DUF3347 [Chitinophaga niastensis]|uniref:Uncharacterized protein DUF3347 n=1 Tax=Chitinophaga niastensis TaxID=536980 RepID=A0A2P8HHQ2_CHINA|nr:DUF3347 domain-containing protein [Chitinophaga niastensis]PSL45719.1 uncharacterized protein DUF3347 [Chitinophaga niastensis]